MKHPIDSLGLPKDVLRAAVEKLEGQPLPVIAANVNDQQVGEVVLRVDGDSLVGEITFNDTDAAGIVQERMKGAGLSVAAKVDRKGLSVTDARLGHVNLFAGPEDQ